MVGFADYQWRIENSTFSDQGQSVASQSNIAAKRESFNVPRSMFHVPRLEVKMADAGIRKKDSQQGEFFFLMQKSKVYVTCGKGILGEID